MGNRVLLTTTTTTTTTTTITTTTPTASAVNHRATALHHQPYLPSRAMQHAVDCLCCCVQNVRQPINGVIWQWNYRVLPANGYGCLHYLLLQINSNELICWLVKCAISIS